MPKNIFEFLKPKAELSRNGFDLSQRHIWSQKSGQVVPCLTIDCVPGDHHEINLLSLTRTMPVKTDAFTRMKLSYTAFFVPYQQSWYKWNEFIAQTQEKFSTLDSTDVIGDCPSVRLGDLLKTIFNNLVHAGVDTYDMFEFSYGYNALRMLDMLGYGSYYKLLDFRDTEPDGIAYCNTFNDKYINLFRVMAYQKVCNDFFRNNQFTVADPALFNVDDAPSNGQIDEETAFAMFSHIWYCQYRKDLFTSLFASPQFGAVSTVDITDVNIRAKESLSLVTVRTEATDRGGLMYNPIADDGRNYKYSIPGAFDVYALRKAEMLQKWKEDKLRAGNKLKDQSLAMFGRRPRYLMDHYADFIKQFDINLSIDEVTNTAAGSSSPLGDVAGKGIGTGQGFFEYDCNDFGTLIIVASILPVQEYDAMQLDKQNTMIEPFDFFTPHFEDLGLEPISVYQLRNDTYWGNVPLHQDVLNRVIGYSPRYAYYKTAIDKVHGEFESSGRIGASEQGGSLSHWVTPRSAYEVVMDVYGGSQEFLYVNPHSVDNIFYMAASDSQDTDPFLFNVNFSVNSVRPMSILGLPRW